MNIWLFMEGLRHGSSYHNYVSCGQGQVIDCHKLQGLEQKIIGLYLNALNRM